jgi:hypothetical protein
MATYGHEAVSGIKPPANLQIDSDKTTSWKKWLQQFEWYATVIQVEKNPDSNIYDCNRLRRN